MLEDDKPINVKLAPEKNALPPGWRAKTDENERVYFLKDEDGATSYNHPRLGALPKPWILIWNGTRESYKNRQTGQIVYDDPRFFKENIEARMKGIPERLRAGANIIRADKPGMMEYMSRPAISTENIRDDFDIVHIIDAGDGTLGAMNGGVFVVRIKNTGKSTLYIEKRFSAKNLAQTALEEIRIAHFLNHPCLTNIHFAFIEPGNIGASVYFEFCDRGSLQDLIKNYSKRDPEELIPEAFLWHAFAGLIDALTYLTHGKGYIAHTNALADPNWAPFIHRDIKPDNVLIRSRTRINSLKYPYLVLSDFGLASEEFPGDACQKSGGICGTISFFAPEQLHDPYPKTQQQMQYFPEGGKHSQKSDVYAVGLCIYNMVFPKTNGNAHIDFTANNLVDSDAFWGGTICRYHFEAKEHWPEIEEKYSKHLRLAITFACQWDPRVRPKSLQLIENIVKWMKAAGYWKLDMSDTKLQLPKWATRVHAYGSKDVND